MNIEKYQQYANSKLKADKMRNNIKETLDNYQMAQTMGYEAAKTQFKPLLEAQEAQTKAQEAQTKAQEAQTLIMQKPEPEEFSKAVQEFIKNFNLPLPSLLLSQGISAYKHGREEIWKEQLLNLSLEITKIIEITDDPTIKKAAAEYRKYLNKVVTTVVTPQNQKDEYTTPTGALSPATSTEMLIEVDPRQKAAEKIYDYPLEVATTTYLEEYGLKFPSIHYLDGLNADAKGKDQYFIWRKKFNRFVRDRSMEEEAATGNKKHILKNYITQLQKIQAVHPGIPTLESNLNNNFTENELKSLKKIQVNTPQEVYNAGIAAKMESPEAYKDWITKTQNESKKLRQANSKKGATNIALRKKYYLKLDYIINNVSDTKIVAGKGRNRKKFTLCSGIFMNPQNLFKKLELITGSILAGNTNKKIRNDGYKILDKLLEIGLITKTIYNKYIKEYLKH